MLGLDFEKCMDEARSREKDKYEEECRAYFSHIATDFYVGKLVGECDKIQRELLREAVRYPFKNIVKIPVGMTNTYWAEQSSKQRTLEDNGFIAGGVFLSPSGWTRRNIYRIFKETDFKSAVLKRLGVSERFFLTMTSEILWADRDAVCYKNVMWLNFRMN
jgi:hypothetical protein